MKYNLLGISKGGQRVDIGTAKMENARQAASYMVALGLECVSISQIVEIHHSNGNVTTPGEEPDELVCGSDIVDHPQLGLLPSGVTSSEHLRNSAINGSIAYAGLPEYSLEDDVNEVCVLRVTEYSGREAQLGSCDNLEKARAVASHFLKKEEQISFITVDRFVEYHYEGGVDNVLPQV